MPAATIRLAPIPKAIAVSIGSPVSTIFENSSGPLMPPAAVPIA